VIKVLACLRLWAMQTSKKLVEKAHKKSAVVAALSDVR
jgi:DNA-binding protein H-NS